MSEVGKKESKEPKLATEAAQQWAADVHCDVIAATLLDPNLITFRSAATDEPEAVVRYKLLAEMIGEFKPRHVKDLQSFLPNLIGNTIK
jgi:hypothetical protein